jgi:all-trans-retinol 13,14-reductase
MELQPSISHVSLYLGFEGDISAAGASSSNTWIYHTWDHDQALWQDPFDQPEPPMLFVSFPSLKDPHHTGVKHTAEVISWVSWDPYRAWEATKHDHRPQDYEAYKDLVRRRLLDQFTRYFPRLAPMLRYDEVSTPLSTLHFTRHERGAVYGLETTPRRFLSRALHVKSPVPGLYLSGQDVCTPGVMGAMMGGVLAASAIDPRIFPKLPR